MTLSKIRRRRFKPKKKGKLATVTRLFDDEPEYWTQKMVNFYRFMRPDTRTPPSFGQYKKYLRGSNCPPELINERECMSNTTFYNRIVVTREMTIDQMYDEAKTTAVRYGPNGTKSCWSDKIISFYFFLRSNVIVSELDVPGIYGAYYNLLTKNTPPEINDIYTVLLNSSTMEYLIGNDMMAVRDVLNYTKNLHEAEVKSNNDEVVRQIALRAAGDTATIKEQCTEDNLSPSCACYETLRKHDVAVAAYDASLALKNEEERAWKKWNDKMERVRIQLGTAWSSICNPKASSKCCSEKSKKWCYETTSKTYGTNAAAARKRVTETGSAAISSDNIVGLSNDDIPEKYKANYILHEDGLVVYKKFPEIPTLNKGSDSLYFTTNPQAHKTKKNSGSSCKSCMSRLILTEKGVEAALDQWKEAYPAPEVSSIGDRPTLIQGCCINSIHLRCCELQHRRCNPGLRCGYRN